MLKVYIFLIIKVKQEEKISQNINKSSKNHENFKESNKMKKKKPRKNIFLNFT
jgi:hypothetical protein